MMEGPDEGIASTAWTTIQVGGDVVYRGGGPVTKAHRSSEGLCTTACSVVSILYLVQSAVVQAMAMIGHKRFGCFPRVPVEHTPFPM